MTNSNDEYVPPSLRYFMESSLHNLWCEEFDFEVYVRQGYHLIEGKGVKTFDVANVKRKGKQGSGRLKELIKYVEELAREFNMPFVYLELVSDDWLIEAYKRYGYTVVNVDRMSVSLYKRM